MDEGNTIRWADGRGAHRKCRACQRAANRRYMRRVRGAKSGRQD